VNKNIQTLYQAFELIDNGFFSIIVFL